MAQQAPNSLIIELRGILCIVLIVAVFFLSTIFKAPVNPGAPISQMVEIGDEGGSADRLAFELLRLESPLTNSIPEGIEKRALVYAKTLPGSKGIPALLERSNGSSSSLKWSLRGPYNVGGRTRALAIDVADSNRIIAGGVSGGIWLSSDEGMTWSKMTKTDQLHSITSIAQDTRDGKTNIWYATTGELSGNSAGARGAPFRGDGIYKSTDNGYNWKLLPSTSTNQPESFDNYLNYSWRIKVHPITGHIFSASYGSIYRSKDEGATWEVIMGNGNDRYCDLAMTSTGVMIAALSRNENQGPVFRSNDGIIWEDITPTVFPASYGRIVVDISESNDSIAYFLASNGDDHNFLKYEYSSTGSSGSNDNWIDRSNNLPNDFNSQNGYDLLVRISPSDENLVFIGGTNLYYTTNGMETTGYTFKIGGYGHDDHHPDQHEVLLYKNQPNKVFSASDGGLHIMQDLTDFFGKKWTSLNNGYVTTQFYTIAIDQSGTYPDLIMGGTQDNGTWESLKLEIANPWSKVFGGDGAYCSVINFGKAYILSSQRGYTLIKDWNNPFNWTYGNGIGKYNNYSWAYLMPPDFDRENDALFISPIYSDPINDHILYYAGGKYIYRNNDVYLNKTNYEQPEGGGSYESKQWEKLEGTSAVGDISAFGSSLANPPQRLYYGTSSGYIYRLDNSHTSNSSVLIKNNLGTSGYISGISVDPYDGNKVMLSFSNYHVKSIYYSNNGGESWTDVSGNLEEMASGGGSGPSVRSVYIYALKTGYRYFAGTSTGLYSTDNLEGTNTVWRQEGSSSIGNIVVDKIVGRPVDGYVAIATHGNGMYSANFANEILAVDESNIPNAFELAQNYPNPFNPSTKIPFNLLEPGLVTVKVFDLMGRELDILFNGKKPSGVNQVNWNGKDRFGKALPSGVYIYQIETDGMVQSKKMHLLK